MRKNTEFLITNVMKYTVRFLSIRQCKPEKNIQIRENPSFTDKNINTYNDKNNGNIHNIK